MTKPTEFEIVDNFCLQYQEQRVNESEVTSAHAKSHLLDVASLSDLAAQARRFPFRTRILLRITSLMHDVKRLPTEDPRVKDELLSAQTATALMENVDKNHIFSNTPSEREAVAFAIENHGKYPDSFKDEQKRESPPQTLKEQLWESIFVGDKMTQNGVWVIARRSAFVAGDRLQEGGDLKAYGFRPKSETYHGDEEIVVVLESALRLTFINPQDIYPKVFRAIVDPLYQVQREFVLGLCSINGIGPTEIAALLLDRKRPDGKNILEVRGITSSNYIDLAGLISNRGGIRDKDIDTTSLDRAQSAKDAVTYFSTRYKDDLVQVALNWRPRGKNARRWQKGMVEYLDGTWYKNVENKLNE